ncbi:MAG: putative protein N(5)-glutamine methyltransferase [Renibacterium salmoninarum]|nr:putative protein N(5)-glutamine methyltransferase [Renibacterium salmoninarum]
MQGRQSSAEHSRLTAALRSAGCVFAEDEATVLLGAAADPGTLAQLLAQRVAGLPLEHIVGWAEFCGRRLAVGPGVFVPRKRTELMAREALRLVQPGVVVLDLCCGSGALGAAVLAAAPDVELYAADLDPQAVAYARRNLPDRAGVFTGDLFAPLPARLRGQIGVLMANAPYVPSGEIPLLPAEARLHEATAALDGGPDGLAVQRRVAEAAPEWLAPGGVLLIETSARQLPLTIGILENCGFAAWASQASETGATVVLGRLADSATSNGLG